MNAMMPDAPDTRPFRHYAALPPPGQDPALRARARMALTVAAFASGGLVVLSVMTLLQH